MKICRLKLKNLNSFREEIELDFENSPLGDASLVAITGPTGAGKTTLLDAICVALYGKTPRLTGQGSQNPNHLISHGEKEGFAEVTFIANGIRYLGTWSAKQKGSPKVALFYADDDKLITDKLSTRGKSLGSSEKTVSEEVEAILGLDFDAFRRSVMLAQGEFAAFLKASDEERRTILEATAGIGIYDELKKALNDKVGAVEAATADVLDKLNKIPEASREQLSEAQTLCDKLQSEAEALGTQSRHIQDEKQREEGRKADFERLQSSKDRQDQLTDQQSEIDALQTTLENANRADRLRPEKQTYDTAKSDLENAEKALDTATEEKTETQAQVKTDQTVYDKKEKVYQTTSQEHAQKIPRYRDAKLDVARAADQFAEADNRTSKLAVLKDEIDRFSEQLADREAERTELQVQIDEAQTFLDENPLPSDRQRRVNRANVLLTQHDSQQEQLDTALASKIEHSTKVSSLGHEIKALSETREELLSEKTSAEMALETATAELNRLFASGTREEWTDRKQQLVQAHPIVQKHEEMTKDSEDMSDRSDELSNALSTLNAELERIEEELREQEIMCQRAAEEVERCEEALRTAMLAEPINQLRQRLQPGEPCSVCGATEHPFTENVFDIFGDSLRDEQGAENALESAKLKAQIAQDQMQNLQMKRSQLQQRQQNFLNQLEELQAEAKVLINESEAFVRQTKEIYPDGTISFDWDAEDVAVSSDWIVEQIRVADITISSLTEAEQRQAAVSHAYEMAAQQFETCETDIRREAKSLSQAEEQLQNADDDVADLQADIVLTEERFWELLPEIFHGVEPKVALDQFSETIKAIETREDGLSRTEAKLNLLEAKIESDQSSFENVQGDHEELKVEIDAYQAEGERFLEAVREKTGGLETEDAISTAIGALEAELQLKATARDGAAQQLQESQTLLTQKQVTHENCERRHEECHEKFEAAHNVYFHRLKASGFGGLEAHENAFRDEAEMQELTDQIDVYESEKQGLELVITELRTRFEETPFDPEALGRIETQVEEIGEQLQAAQQEVGAQQQKIDNLKDALEKREALGDEMKVVEQELNRWQRLQDTIPRNDLRDFALEIMFKQMGNLANEQLKYLTSERYQLKVEGIGDLTVIDRWNANEERPVETLSGGESFLTSLALALALSELSRGRAQLNSLFLDEGFGTLDTETLEIAIAALEGLRMQGRSIFLISHIQELTRRLSVKINVRKRGNGSSYIGN